jgi:hypothetical protein
MSHCARLHPGRRSSTAVTASRCSKEGGTFAAPGRGRLVLPPDRRRRAGCEHPSHAHGRVRLPPRLEHRPKGARTLTGPSHPDDRIIGALIQPKLVYGWSRAIPTATHRYQGDVATELRNVKPPQRTLTSARLRSLDATDMNRASQKRVILVRVRTAWGVIAALAVGPGSCDYGPRGGMQRGARVDSDAR